MFLTEREKLERQKDFDLDSYEDPCSNEESDDDEEKGSKKKKQSNIKVVKADWIQL